jgi:DNA invertase Pin-like site-specific DNA recombinase
MEPPWKRYSRRTPLRAVVKGHDKRPAFDKLCRDAARREFDMVMAWSVDRLGRSLQDLVGFLSELHALKIDLFLRQQGLDTTTPSGKAMFQMMGVFAEFERAMIAERVRAGLARARSEGKRLLGGPVCASLPNKPAGLLSEHHFTEGSGSRRTGARVARTAPIAAADIEDAGRTRSPHWRRQAVYGDC